MKSKRADEYLFDDGYEEEFRSMDTLIPVHDAVKAVELAEEDARERAVKAYCATQTHTHGCPDYPCGYECVGQIEFLKAYDDEA